MPHYLNAFGEEDLQYLNCGCDEESEPKPIEKLAASEFEGDVAKSFRMKINEIIEGMPKVEFP